MKILFLGYLDSPLIKFLQETGAEVLVTNEKITIDFLSSHKPDFLISYGYRYIIKQEILDYFLPSKAINLHISYLPWNRGSDPNLWSFIENTPKGVTIHYLDAGIDTGDIILQQEVQMQENDTLSTSYNRLHETIMALFKNNWDDIKSGRIQAKPQNGKGTLHKSKDKENIMKSLENGFDTCVAKLRNLEKLP